MTGFVQATLWANETLICEVNLFWEKEKEYVTVASKTNQKVLLFQESEELTLQYQQGVHLYKEQVIFHEVKMLNRKPYYVFRVLPQNNTSSLIEPFSAMFSTEFENGMTSIIDVALNRLTLVHEKPLQGRTFEVTFKENNQLRQFFGKAIWAKKEEQRHYYQLLSI